MEIPILLSSEDIFSSGPICHCHDGGTHLSSHPLLFVFYCSLFFKIKTVSNRGFSEQTNIFIFFKTHEASQRPLESFSSSEQVLRVAH